MATALEEYLSLKHKFPRAGTDQLNCENCDWGDHICDSVNCYWIFDSAEIQESMYSFYDWKVISSIDTLWNSMCERCYEVSDSVESADSSFCQYIAHCYNMQYSYDCSSCHDCFGCSNLSNKDHCIFNIQYTEKEYEEKVSELKKQPPTDILDQVEKLRLKFPKIQSNFLDNINSDYVNYVYKSKNAYYCFDSNVLEDCGYTSNANECKDSWDTTMVNSVEQCAECTDSRDCYNCYEAQDCTRCTDSSFIYSCIDSNNLFMCSNLSNASYCILNVQYTKEEYEKKVSEIKKELGLMFSQPV